jgi:hypothetical protein
MDSPHPADVSEAPLSDNVSAFDAENRDDGEARRDEERAEEAAFQAEAAHEAPDQQEGEHEQEPEQELGKVDALEAHPEETPGEPEPPANEREPLAPEYQEPERWMSECSDGDRQDLEEPMAPIGADDQGHAAMPEPVGLDRHEPAHAEPAPDDDGQERKAGDEQDNNERGDELGDSEEKRSVISRTVVINVGESVEVSGEGGRRGWWQRLLS